MESLLKGTLAHIGHRQCGGTCQRRRVCQALKRHSDLSLREDVEHGAGQRQPKVVPEGLRHHCAVAGDGFQAPADEAARVQQR